MVKRIVSVILLFAAAGTPLGAWGFDAHKFITARAIELLPPGMKGFYEKRQVFLVEHSIDPDLYRSAGFTEETPRHFLDFDAYGAYPFTDLPRDYNAALQKYGREKLASNGLLPWRADEIYGKLVGAFKQAQAGSPYSGGDIAYFSAVLAHYVEDAHQPLHACVNYDGQLTGQRGIHSRFEDELFRRYQAKLKIAASAHAPAMKPLDFMFDTLLASFKHVDPLLRADREAIGTGEEYDDGYFERLLKGSQSILERRIGDSIGGVVAVWIGAWESAGKPDILTERPPQVRKVRRRGR